jgi:hypothetical protein
MESLRVINFETDKHFECAGRKFYLRESLSFVRYRELQKINLEFGYSATFHDLFKRIREAWELLNAVKLGEAAVVLHNVMYGVVNLDQKEDPALRLCALFIDEEGEDPTVYNEAKMSDKIECWGKELAVDPFFHLAANLVSGWISAFNRISQNGLGEEVTQKEEQPQ